MNRSTEKICAGHYLVKTDECGQFSVSKHAGEWVLRHEGNLIDRYSTKKEAMRRISESRREVRYKKSQDARKTTYTNTYGDHTE